MKSGKPPRFRVALPPYAVRPTRNIRPPKNERGLDSRWERMSIAFRRQNPFCRFCEQRGRDTLAELVDHILPRREYPQLTYVWKNCQSLCRHDDGVKQAMEIYARERGLLEELPLWCADPKSRPERFRPVM